MIWQLLNHPLHVVKLDDYWIISTKGTVHNVMIDENGYPIVYKDEQEAEDAFAFVKQHRQDIKYMRKIP